MVVGGKKGGKFNKTQRGVERQFTSETELQAQAQQIKRRDMPSDSEEESDNEPEERKVANPAAAVIEISNPNKQTAKPMKLKDLSINDDEEAEQPQLTRREREALEKEQKKQHYFKLQMEGKTDQARADLARLAMIRKQREEAKLKREETEKAAKAKKEESLNAGKSITSKAFGKK
ncbi:heat- and acid-stable phosphoprotein [Boothiomyces sp. JEL0838]|nr:heat- and acid-stable phosphoprotein [Boothiomyces sp. JEL0838]